MEIRSDQKYASCDLQRPKHNIAIDRETIESLSKEFDVLPLFEKKHHDLVISKHNSLVNNQYLKRRWKAFLNTLEGRKKTPFVFPNHNDFHFYLYHNCYAPKQSVHLRPHYRRQMCTGPGVDCLGQIPTPDDMHLKRAC